MRDEVSNDPPSLLRHILNLILIAVILLALFSGAAIAVYYIIDLLNFKCLLQMAPSNQCGS